MIPTPDLSHLTDEDYNVIYEPAGAYKGTFWYQQKRRISKSLFSFTEDTFLLLDALESDADDLKMSRALICLEVG